MPSGNNDLRAKNVVLITFDSLRWDAIANAEESSMPNLCKARDDGAYFEGSIVQAPFTIPSHASILTGRYPARIGVRDMHHRIPKGTPTVFTTLKNAGYSTFSSSPTSLFAKRGFEGIDKRVKFNPESFRSALNEQNGRPFFAFLHYWDIHTPYETRFPGWNPKHLFLNLLKPMDAFKQVPKVRRIVQKLWLARVKRIRKLMKRGDPLIREAIREGYRRSVVDADRYLGRITSVLESLELARDTVLVLTSDHGDSFNDHNEASIAVGIRYEHGQFLYDDVLKVPLIMYWPGRKVGRRSAQQVSHTDIMPTVLDILGMDSPGNLDGESLWNCISSGEAVVERPAFSEAVRESIEAEIRSVRTPEWKLIHNYRTGEYELYDLVHDPGEKKNLWPGNDCPEKDDLVGKLAEFATLAYRSEEDAAAEDSESITSSLKSLGYM